MNDRLLLVAYEAQTVADELRGRLDPERDPRGYVTALLEALNNELAEQRG